jgi:hypothetical protein
VGLASFGLAACVSGFPQADGGAAESEAASAASPASEDHRPMELNLERAPEPGEAVHVRVSAGVLPEGANIRVRLPDGELIGSIAPYGIPEGQKAGTYAMALPRDRSVEGPVILHFELVIEGQEPRAPTDGELEAVELVFVGIEPPITPP